LPVKRHFLKLTIKGKLTLLLMATSGLAVGLVCTIFYFLVAQSFQKDYTNDLNSLIDILGHNCEAALTFNVPEDAAAVLGTLSNRPSLLAVRLYDRNHTLFADYTRSPTVGGPPVTDGGGLDSKTSLKVEQPIQLIDGTVVGRIIAYDDIRGIGLSQKKWLLLLAAAGTVALAAAYLFASLLQNSISRPLLVLTAAVQRLAVGDFSTVPEIALGRQDEMGVLSSAFVEMSRKLDDSYAALAEYNRELETRVVARTEELQRAMEGLTKSQAQLVQSEKMVAVGHLVAGVAHEINNSLNFMTGAIPTVSLLLKKMKTLLSEGDEPGHDLSLTTAPFFEKMATLLNNAEIGLQRTVRIVSDLNTFARPSQGRFVPTDMHREIDMVVTLLHYEMRDRIVVQQHFSPTLPLAFCLRDQINQVIMNVLRNAIQAIAGPGVIDITTSLEGAMVNLSFHDSGCGIPPEVIDQIFNPFFSTKEVGKGTGLGLAISYGIMQNHHGEIVVDSTVGQGTTVTLRLPVVQGSAPVEVEG